MRRVVVLGVLAGLALAAPAIAHGAPPIQRPNPLFVTLKVDYISPLPTPTGIGEAVLQPVQFKTTNQSIRDLQYLKYGKVDDLGGFAPARVGKTFQAGGSALVGRGNKPEIPLYGVYERNLDRSYTWLHGIGTGPLTNEGGGAVFVPGLGGVPPVVAPPTNGNTTPPANQGFAGRPGGTTTTTIVTTVQGSTTSQLVTTTTSTGHTTTRRRTTTRTTTTTATTTSPGTTTFPSPPTLFTTTTTPTTTGSSPPTPTPPTPPTDCGTIDVSVTSDLNCLFIITNAKPGDSIVENYTITNTGSVGYDVALNITNDNPPDNHLWNDLTMGVWETPGPAPSPFPPLNDWVPSFITLDHLNPGQTIHLRFDCLLPTTSGNADMHLAAVMTLHFRATG